MTAMPSRRNLSLCMDEKFTVTSLVTTAQTKFKRRSKSGRNSYTLLWNSQRTEEHPSPTDYKRNSCRPPPAIQLTARLGSSPSEVAIASKSGAMIFGSFWNPQARHAFGTLKFRIGASYKDAYPHRAQSSEHIFNPLSIQYLQGPTVQRGFIGARHPGFGPLG